MAAGRPSPPWSVTVRGRLPRHRGRGRRLRAAPDARAGSAGSGGGAGCPGTRSPCGHGIRAPTPRRGRHGPRTARQNTRTGDRVFAGTRDRMAIRCSTPLAHRMITERKRRAADRDCAVPHMHHVRGETPNEPDHQPARRHRPLRGLARLTIAPPGAVAPRPTGAAAPSCARRQPRRPGPTKAGSAAKSGTTPTASASAPRVRRTRVRGWSGNSASHRSWSAAWNGSPPWTSGA